MKELNLEEMKTIDGQGIIGVACYIGGTLSYGLGVFTVFSYSEWVGSCENY